MTGDQQDRIASLSTSLDSRPTCPVEELPSGDVHVIYEGRTSGIRWVREYVIAPDGKAVEIPF